MEGDLVLAKLDRARTALAEAKTIQETKHIIDIAISAEIFAKRQKLGEDAIYYATSIKIEALAQLGKMLKETPRNPGGRPSEVTCTSEVQVIPTLPELGIDRKTSQLAQDIAELTEEQLDKIKEGKTTVKNATQKNKKQKAVEAIKLRSEEARNSDRWNLECADIRDWNASRQYDFIITDPPYPKEFLSLYETLATRAAEWLAPGGLLIAMCGQSYLNEIYAMMDNHLQYYWTAAYLTPGQPTPLRQKQVNTTWKPLLIYMRKGDKYTGKTFGDVFKSDGNDKSLHEWGQSISGMSSIVQGICLPGQYILDPFCGAGTTGIAALSHGCLFDGIDISDENVKIVRGRLNDSTAQ